MRNFVFIAIYVFIGIGVTAAAEARSGYPVGGRDLYMAVMIWPGTIAAIAYTKWTSPDVSCPKGGAS